MAQQVGTTFYDEVCNMPACMCANCPIFIFLRNGALTSDGKPYIIGTVTLINQLSTGGVEVTFTYDDATLPVVGEDPIEITFGEDGTACDPDCGSDCSWMVKMLSVLDTAAIAGLQNRHYILYAENEVVVDGTFSLPRIPFPTGFRLTSLKITCFVYNANTQGTFKLKVLGVTVGEFIGTLAAQRSLTISSGQELLAYDAMPVMELSDVEQTVYGAFALGLVIELIGVLGA